MSNYEASQRAAKMSILAALFRRITHPCPSAQYRLRVIQGYFELLKEVK